MNPSFYCANGSQTANNGGVSKTQFRNQKSIELLLRCTETASAGRIQNALRRIRKSYSGPRWSLAHRISI